MRVSPGEVDLSGHTLILPGCDSLGHLGELCVDALVATFGLRRAAVVESQNLLPVVMASAWELPAAGDAPLTLTTAAEIYQSAELPKLSVLQLRSPPAEGRRRALGEEIWAWAREKGVAEVVVVSSCSSHIKVDADLAASSELRYVRAGAPSEGLPELGPEWLFLGHAVAPEELTAHGETVDVAAAKHLLRGGGLARPFLLSAAAGESAGAPPTLCLLGLTGEGVNWPLTKDFAMAVSGCIAARMGFAAPTPQVPPSWQYEAARPEQYLFG